MMHALKEYKAQQGTERGFRFLKDPLFFASSVFLKTPKRIAALDMIMALCLLVYKRLLLRLELPPAIALSPLLQCLSNSPSDTFADQGCRIDEVFLGLYAV
jgi:hypothetical protein